MRTFVLLSATLLSGAISTGVFAHQYTCAATSWVEPTASGSLYTFIMTSRCTLTADRALDVLKMKDAFARQMSSSADIRVLSMTSTSSVNAMSGKLLNVSETRHTDHGLLKIEGKVSLMDNGKNAFMYNYTSDSVDGEDKAKYTKYEQLIIEVSPMAGATTYQVVFKKTNKVEKPWYAPSGKFKEKAQEGIEEDFEVFKKGHMQVLVGAI
jgi:hypothetical protein